jgi:hypothetical protein
LLARFAATQAQELERQLAAAGQERSRLQERAAEVEAALEAARAASAEEQAQTAGAVAALAEQLAAAQSGAAAASSQAAAVRSRSGLLEQAWQSAVKVGSCFRAAAGKLPWPTVLLAPGHQLASADTCSKRRSSSLCPELWLSFRGARPRLGSLSPTDFAPRLPPSSHRSTSNCRACWMVVRSCGTSWTVPSRRPPAWQRGWTRRGPPLPGYVCPPSAMPLPAVGCCRCTGRAKGGSWAALGRLSPGPEPLPPGPCSSLLSACAERLACAVAAAAASNAGGFPGAAAGAGDGRAAARGAAPGGAGSRGGWRAGRAPEALRRRLPALVLPANCRPAISRTFHSFQHAALTASHSRRFKL